MSQISRFHNPSRRIGGTTKQLRELIAIRKSAAIRSFFAAEARNIKFCLSRKLIDAPVRKLLTAQRKIVPVNDLDPTFDAKDKHDVAGRPALDLVGIGRVVGHETPADLGAVGAAHEDGVTPRELSLDPDDADRQQAIAAPQRG